MYKYKNKNQCLESPIVARDSTLKRIETDTYILSVLSSACVVVLLSMTIH